MAVKKYTVEGYNPESMTYQETDQTQASKQTSNQTTTQTSRQESTSRQDSTSNQRQTSDSRSTQETSKTLNEELAQRILAGLQGYMSDSEIQDYAQNLLLPQLNAGLEAAQQQYDTQALSTQQQIDQLAAQLQRSIQDQQSAYKQSMADVENAALARGMGRSSYLLQTLAGQGQNLAEQVSRLTEDTNRQQTNLAQQLALAAQQNAQTQGRLNTDYAAQLASKVQEIRQNQINNYNQNYLTAISSALGSNTYGTTNTVGDTVGTQSTVGNQVTNGSSTQNTAGESLTQTAANSGSTQITFKPGNNSTSSGGDVDNTVKDASKTGNFSKLVFGWT